MADLNLGYKFGDRVLSRFLVDGAATFDANDMVALDSDGYLIKAVSGSNVIGVAFDPQTTASGTDGATEVRVDVSQSSVYLFTAASVTQAMAGKTCDVASSQAIDVAASTDDCILIVTPYPSLGQAEVQIRHVRAGVV